MFNSLSGVNMVNWFVIIKKGEFVEFVLIGCSVLMITNLIDILHLSMIDQTGSANRLYS